MSSQTMPLSAAVTATWRPPLDACRWRYVMGSGGWRTFQHNHVQPSAAVLRARSKQVP